MSRLFPRTFMKRYINHISLLQHYRFKHAEKSVTCPHCQDDVEYTKAGLSLHIKDNHRRIRCRYCDYTNKKIAHVRKHEMGHVGHISFSTDGRISFQYHDDDEISREFVRKAHEWIH